MITKVKFMLSVIKYQCAIYENSFHVDLPELWSTVAGLE